LEGCLSRAKSNATNKISSGDIILCWWIFLFRGKNRSRLGRAKYGMLVNAFYDDRHFDVKTSKYHNLLDENVRLKKIISNSSCNIMQNILLSQN
jgi:hypothetical protein